MDTSEKQSRGGVPKKRISLFLFFTTVCVAVIALLWQARVIGRQRAENNTLRKDLRIALANGIDNTGSSDAAQAQREKLELIKLRYQVRELNESIAASHAVKPGKLGEVLNSLLPTPAPSPAKLRPEWKGMETMISNQYLQAMQNLRGATNDEYVRFLSLDRAAKTSFAVGRSADARQFATDMLVLNEKFSRGSPEKSNGDAIHDANLILGRIALGEGRLDEAKKFLLAAGKSTGSPILDSFGPNMGLAKDLLEKKEQEVVLQYLELVRKFWKSDKLDLWIKDIHAGRMPDFGANLIF